MVFAHGIKPKEEERFWQEEERKEGKSFPFSFSSQAMLPKKNRLTKKSEFSEVLAKGRIFQGPLFGTAVYKRNDGLPAKIGIIVSKKISKLAVKRNRAKRLLRESLRRLIKNAPDGNSIVFLTKKKLLEATLDEVYRETERLFGEIKKGK